MTTHGTSPEPLADINERIWKEALEEHKLFSEAFKAGQCYLCSDALTKFDHAKPCPHWLLKPERFSKNHFERA